MLSAKQGNSIVVGMDSHRKLKLTEPLNLYDFKDSQSGILLYLFLLTTVLFQGVDGCLLYVVF